MSCGPRHGTSNDHRSECAKQVEVRIRRFHWPGVEGFVESREAVAADFDATRSDAGPGAETVHYENYSEESRKLAAVGTLIVRMARDEVQTHYGASVGVDNSKGRCPELVFEGPVADGASRASSERRKDRLEIRWKRNFLDSPRRSIRKVVERLRKRQLSGSERVGHWGEAH